MLKRHVVVKYPLGGCYGKTGIVVAVSTGQDNLSETQCKVLIGNKISNWIPDKYLEVINDNYQSA